jgi:BASS family bile acid:Na+ symporter
MWQRLLVVWLCLLSLAAVKFPDPFVAGKDYLGVLFAAAMLAIGSLLPRDEVREVARRWPVVLFGTALQYTSMPLLAFGMGHLFGLGADTMLGMVLVGCVPGAMASNVLTLAAGGNVSYSVSLTTLSTLLSPLCVPLALSLLAPAGTAAVAESGADLTFAKQAGDLLWMVVGPVVTGYLLSRCWPAWRAATRRCAAPLANLAILWVIATIVAMHHHQFAKLDGALYAALLAVNVLGYTVGYLGGAVLRLPEPMRRALTLEIGMQNAGLGSLLAQRWFAPWPAAALPPVLYMFGCMLSGTLLATAWGWHAAPAARPHRAGTDADGQHTIPAASASAADASGAGHGG